MRRWNFWLPLVLVVALLITITGGTPHIGVSRIGWFLFGMGVASIFWLIFLALLAMNEADYPKGPLAPEVRKNVQDTLGK